MQRTIRAPRSAATILLTLGMLVALVGLRAHPAQAVPAATTYPGSGVPAEIPDGDTLTSTLTVPPGEPFIDDLDVTMTLTHESADDLDVFLEAPSGVTVELFTDVCATENRWGEVLVQLDDEGSTPIGTDCPPPPDDQYQPEGLLSAFDGQTPSGEWTLTVTDDTAGGAPGQLHSWSITVTPPDPIVVNSAADPGAGVCDAAECTLREAITLANTDAAGDTIAFNIPSFGVATIATSMGLPQITSPVIIDGYTQPGSSENTLAVGNNAVLHIVLDGSFDTGVPAADAGLKISAGDSTVRGLVINGVPLGDGIVLHSNGGNTIQGNFIGTIADGTAADGNGNGGVRIFSGNNTVGGEAPGARNVISGNGGNGVVISSAGATGNQILGNYIGTGDQGTTDVGNAVHGVSISSGATNNVIGGISAAARNVISGNNQNGVVIIGTGVTGNTIEGNHIGTDATGSVDLGNSEDGVLIERGPNTIGGTAAGAGNVISGNNSDGIEINGVGASGNTVQGNYIGTNAAGTTDLGNDMSGVRVDGASINTIGGPAVGAGNTISGNEEDGVVMVGCCTNTVQGNYIGTNDAGSTDLGNTGYGARLVDGAQTLIGGTSAGEGNAIAFNGAGGVAVVDDGSSVGLPHFQVRGNSIHSNEGLGIDLADDGVTLNDSGDADSGPNDLQNFPVITSASAEGGGTIIEGTLNSTPNTTFDLDFFTNDTCDLSGHGEGETYLGSAAVTTDGSGNVSFSEAFASSVGPGQSTTATATDITDAGAPDTSEFSACNPPLPIVVNSTNDPGAGTCDAAECTLRAAIDWANATAATDMITFNIGTGPVTINLVSGLPSVTDQVVIDGTTQPGYSGTPIMELNGAGAGATADGLKITAGDSTVRGLVINRFGGDGIELSGAGGNILRGNYIGTDAAGTADLGNGAEGVRIDGSAGNLIGGGASEAGNLISGNSARGVAIFGSGATGNIVRGNRIGTDAVGTGNLGNGIHGVSVSLGASNSVIGGQGPNTVAFNGGDGVRVTAGTGNRILRNSVHSNGELGIDLGSNGVTPNDAGDEDTGANMLQNFPVLDAALVGGGATAVFGTLESEADTDYRLHFWHSSSCDPSGNGEGQTYLGNKLVSTDSDGLASFRATFAQMAQNRQVAAVAVDPQGNTSEFSACEPTTLRPTLAIDDVTVTEGNSGTTAAIFTVTRSGNTGGTASVNFATANVTAVAPGDYTTTSGTLSFASGETTKTITVNVVGDVLDEPNETFRVNLSAPVDASITDSQGAGTITDDDPAPTLSINDVTVVEGDSGTARPIFTVSLSGASGQTVTVNYSTANGTAVAPGDYTAKSGTLSFSPGVTTQTITVRVNGDNAVEADETYFVNLSGATNATISDGQGQGTIQNDD